MRDSLRISAHPYNQLFPSAPDYDGREIEFADRPLGADPLADLSVPEDCETVFW